MQTATIATAFATIFVAELPDKTMLATIVLSARFARPWAVWIGAAVALTAQMVIAVTAGRLLALLADRVASGAVAVLFAVGAILLWRSSDAAEVAADPEGAQAAQASIGATSGAVVIAARRAPWWRVSATVLGIVFLAEWGDLTQLATASLAARGDAVSVFVGAAAAMVTVAGIGVLAGRALMRILSERVLRRLAAGIFAVLSIAAVIAFIGG